ncbi:MAG: ribonuclease [Clostridia bacterium]|nr:ribonuclease [Lachnospiraceae bacterium]MBQ7541036.1 ribonuclease [Clostridia bacterium]
MQIPDLTNTEPTQQITAETQTKAPEGEEPTQTRAASPPETQTKETKSKASAASRPETQTALDKNGSYYSRDDVALYIHTFGHLPSNFLTKQQAQSLGWSGGSLERYAPGKVIGGDRFGNYEGLLPEKSGRYYFECDIDTKGKARRGSKRIVFSTDGLIYYTDDHYNSFTLLYGEG